MRLTPAFGSVWATATIGGNPLPHATPAGRNATASGLSPGRSSNARPAAGTVISFLPGTGAHLNATPAGASGAAFPSDGPAVRPRTSNTTPPRVGVSFAPPAQTL